MKRKLHLIPIKQALNSATSVARAASRAASHRAVVTFLSSFSIALLYTSLFCVSASAIPLARLRRLEPTVFRQKERASGWIVARERDALSYGDTIRTGTRGKADVLFANGTKIALRGGTSIQILSPSKPNSPLVIRLFGALSEVFVRPKGNTQIRTAAAIAAARGTEYLVRLVDEKTTQVTVTEGSVDFSNEQGSVLVEANQQSVAHLGSAPETPVAVDVSGALRWTADVIGLPLEWETPFHAMDAKTAQRTLETAQQIAMEKPQNLAAQQNLAEALYDANEYSNSAAQFEKVLQSAPQNVAALVGLSRAHCARGDGDSALEAANRAAQIAPEDGTVALEIAFANLVRGDENAARAILVKLENSASREKAQARAVLGFIALRDGDAIAAENAFRTALTAAPSLYQARALLALSLLTQNRIADAEVAARLATQTQPFSAQSQGALSMVLFFRNDISEAQKCADKALRINPNSPFALLTQGRVLAAQGRFEAAHDVLATAQAVAPRLPLVAVELGEVYLRLGQTPKAEQNFRNALAQSPDFAAAHSGLGAALEARGENDAALAQFQRALQLDGQNTTARARLVSFYIASGNLPEAEAEIPKNLVSTPENALLLARLSELNLFRQNLLTAEAYARRAVILLPDSSLAHYQLGRVYFEQGRTFQAEQQFRQATILDRENTAARFALGTVREQIESGRDFSRASSLLNEANLGGAGRGISLQNLQAPGAEDRVQAVLQDPTVARIATRSYGDTQIDGSFGSKKFLNGNVSSLLESRDKQNLFGFSASHLRLNGAFDNTEQESEKASAIFGHKTKNNDAGLVFMVQTARDQQGMNTDNFSAFSRNANSGSRRKMFLLGGTLHPRPNERTRFLLRGLNIDEGTTGFAFDASTKSTTDNYGFELRHDWVLGTRNYLSAGFSAAKANTKDVLLPGSFPFPISEIKNRYRTQQAYLRNEFRSSARLTLTGELQWEQTDEKPTPFLASISRSKTFLLPKFIVDYKAGKNDTVRLRARRFAGKGVDMELLRPSDLFLNVSENLVRLTSRGHGDSFEAEAEHTFANSSFLRANLFQQKLSSAQEPAANIGSGAFISSTRIRGLNLDYESPLGRDATFYVSGRWTNARDEGRNRRVAFIPDFLGEAGLQFLREDGFFVQPSYVYQSSRIVPDASTSNRAKSPGFGLLNLRVGKRNGLNSVVYGEIANVFGQKFDILGVRQNKQQFRVGLSKRF